MKILKILLLVTSISILFSCDLSPFQHQIAILNSSGQTLMYNIDDDINGFIEEDEKSEYVNIDSGDFSVSIFGFESLEGNTCDFSINETDFNNITIEISEKIHNSFEIDLSYNIVP